MATAYELAHGGPHTPRPVHEDRPCVCGHLMTQHEGGTGRCQACALRTSAFMLPGCRAFFSAGPVVDVAQAAPPSEEALWSLNVSGTSVRLITINGWVTRAGPKLDWMVGCSLDTVGWWAWRHHGYVELMRAPESTRRAHEVVG